MSPGRRTSAPGRVRIIGGELRGSVLAVPDRPGLRPTPGRLRETLFNWLQAHVVGARCLDLFAGSGALAVEAISRGAGQACLIERDADLAAALQTNLARLRRQDLAQVLVADALSLLAASASQSFDIVFVDPPFAEALWDRAMALLEAQGWVASRAWIYLEMPVGTHVDPPSAWLPERETVVGDVRGRLYRRRADPVS
ncbi:MAG TPA: 16S rRNA (guanine(966)-N(2))-methyltransferase RsmD [Rhodanobacteraceae bacterium]